MNTNDGRLWTLETVALGSRHHPMSAFRYCYQVENAAGDIIRREWNMVPRIYPFDPTKDYTMPDSWRDIPFQYHMYTSAYAVTMYGSAAFANISVSSYVIVQGVGSAAQTGSGTCRMR